MNHSHVSFLHVYRLFLPYAENMNHSKGGVPLRRIDDDHTAYLPTPTDIVRETAAIRATWSPEVERSRGGLTGESPVCRKQTRIRIIRSSEIDWPNE